MNFVMQSKMLPNSDSSGRKVLLATQLGHSVEVREALEKLDQRLLRGPVTLLGPLAPDAALRGMYQGRGALEGDPAEFRAATRTVVVPLTGLPRLIRQDWKDSGHDILDLTLPSVKRAQSSLRLLSLEGCRPMVLGHQGDLESWAIAGEAEGAMVIDDADQAASLSFAPKFGLVCQTRFTRRRAVAITEALRQRHPDSTLDFLDTTTPAMLERERSVEAFSRRVGAVVVAGDAEESSVCAVIETARRLGLQAIAVGAADAPDLREIGGELPVALVSGDFCPDHRIHEIARKLAG